MNTIKKLLSFFCLMMLCIQAFAVSCENKISILFVVTAQQATIKKENHGYVLTLQNLSPQALYFSERPKHFGGYVQTESFMQRWANHKILETSPPNAAIVFTQLQADKNGMTKSLPVEIYNVQKSATGWTLNIGSKSLDSLQNFPNGILSQVSLFIDGSYHPPYSPDFPAQP